MYFSKKKFCKFFICFNTLKTCNTYKWDYTLSNLNFRINRRTKSYRKWYTGQHKYVYLFLVHKAYLYEHTRIRVYMWHARIHAYIFYLRHVAIMYTTLYRYRRWLVWPEGACVCVCVLTFLPDALRLGALDALVLGAAITRTVNGYPRVRVTRQLHNFVLARHFAAEFIYRRRRRPGAEGWHPQCGGVFEGGRVVDCGWWSWDWVVWRLLSGRVFGGVWKGLRNGNG